jgi:preprotein translocase subunit SecE
MAQARRSRRRAGRVEKAGATAYLRAIHGQESGSMARTNPLQFIQQVRAEVSKITWPTRREVLLTTAMVFVMATLTAIFFFLVDLVIRTGLQAILGMFG